VKSAMEKVDELINEFTGEVKWVTQYQRWNLLQ
jgi:hypothetical protein